MVHRAQISPLHLVARSKKVSFILRHVPMFRCFRGHTKSIARANLPTPKLSAMTSQRILSRFTLVWTICELKPYGSLQVSLRTSTRRDCLKSQVRHKRYRPFRNYRGPKYLGLLIQKYVPASRRHGSYCSSEVLPSPHFPMLSLPSLSKSFKPVNATVSGPCEAHQLFSVLPASSTH